MSFGRKGLAPGQTAPAPAGGFGRAGAASASARTAAPEAIDDPDDIAAKREAFIAAERERKAAELGQGSLPDSSESYADDPMAHLRNSSRPATRVAEPFGGGLHGSGMGAGGMSAQQEAEIRAAARSMARGEAPPRPGYGSGGSGGSGGASSGFVFGDPAGRSVGLAYVLWFVLGQFSVHRFYCGQKDTAILQVGLWLGSLVTLFIFPPIGFVGFLAWICWIIGDLFMIPGMLRKFKAQNDYRAVFS